MIIARSSDSLRVLAKDAVVLDAFHAGGAGAGDGLVVDHIFLQPEIRNAETDHVIDDGRHVLRGAEYVDQVDSSCRVSFCAAAWAESRSG